VDPSLVQCNILCPRCLEKEETVDHAFMRCQYAARIWFGSKLGIKFDNNQIRFVDWLTHSINNLKEEDISYVAAITYGIWFARNRQVFDLKCMDNRDVIDKASRCIQEFQLALANDHPSNPIHNHNAATRSRPNRDSTRLLLIKDGLDPKMEL
jgi:hypothetical protein